ncbi:PDZ domain-containing protein, partial [Oryctes borbonicus]
MADPLVDAEGFPLSHIDIYQIRYARQKIICLQNDHKNIMKQIEVGLYEYYSSSKVANFNSITKQNASSVKPLQQYKDPFAKVIIVTEGSPAAYAGLKVGDLIVEFGSINVANFKNMKDIGNVVKHSEGCQLNVKLRRNEDYIVTHILPKRWAGPGLLGCNIVEKQMPSSNSEMW